MTIELYPAKLSGEIEIVKSKSAAHRVLILSALSDQPTSIFLGQISNDIQATINCLTALGAQIVKKTPFEVIVYPIKEVPLRPLLDCDESGSTLRFLLPIAAALTASASFAGKGRLPDRPLSPLKEELEKCGICFSNDKLPFTIKGKVANNNFSLAGDISSQFISGLLMTLPLLGGGSITLTTELESKGYIDITLDAMKRFGVEAKQTTDGYQVDANARYASAKSVSVEGDWSNAAFFLVGGAICGDVSVYGLNKDSPQGDKKILDILKKMGADIAINETHITAKKSDLQGIDIDARDIPDLVPILAVAASAAAGTTRILNAGRLRIKESDRLTAMFENLSALGVDIRQLEDALVINGGRPVLGGKADSFSDHRIAMSLSILAGIAKDKIKLTGAQAAAKSYPDFYQAFVKVGGIIHVV
jgi:3-phosphoshikimate 1-carboxyvinyltransferase